jgi:hypothetical protein
MQIGVATSGLEMVKFSIALSYGLLKGRSKIKREIVKYSFFMCERYGSGQMDMLKLHYERGKYCWFS